MDEARDHFRRGTAAYALGDYQKAAQEYETAFSIEPNSALLYNAAQAHRVAGNKQRALALYQSYLRFYGDDPKVKNQDEVRRHIDELKRALATDEKTANSPPTAPAQLHPRAPGEPPPTTAPATTAPPEPGTTTPPPAAPANVTPATSTTAAAPSSTSERPIYKKGWFWGVVAGGVVVVAGAITLGVVLGSSTQYPSATMGIARGN